MTQDGEPPPLARGRRQAARPYGARPRTTPAGAGPTLVVSVASPLTGNHPRWRGADHAAGRWPGRGAEPPPLARGRPLHRTPVLGTRGTTPAGAGPTAPPRLRIRRSTNHPRWRGADWRWRTREQTSREPPPLARGRHTRRQEGADGQRTTPAGAGPTVLRPSLVEPLGNHPRWRGADGGCQRGSGGVCEPPPLARGRRVIVSADVSSVGTTPAGAGPTPGPPCAPSPHANHPRWRGADRDQRDAGTTDLEPPPLARGRPRPADARIRAARTTPAGAGPTRPPPESTGRRANHPRWRGADP